MKKIFLMLCLCTWLSSPHGVRAQTLLDLQYQHRFADLKPNTNIDSLVETDRMIRAKMIQDWSVSLERVDSLVLKWDFLDTLMRAFRSATLVSMYEADTLGMLGNVPHGLYVIALDENEYTLPFGKKEADAAYYARQQHLIVLRVNYLQDNYSLRNAQILFHELCHYYLRDKKMQDDYEHDWIEFKVAEMYTRLSNSSFCNRFESLVYVEAAFNESETYEQLVCIRNELEHLWRLPRRTRKIRERISYLTEQKNNITIFLSQITSSL